jgi:hypothetical protein
LTTETVIIGRAHIAHALGRSERTVTRWVQRGVLPASKDGLFQNNVLQVRAADVQRLKHGEGEDD